MTQIKFLLPVLLLALIPSLNAKGQTIKNGSTIDCKSYQWYTQNADGVNRLTNSFSNNESYGEGRKYNRFQFLLEDNLILQHNWLKDEVYEIISPFSDFRGDTKGWLVIKRSDSNYPTIILLEDSEKKYIKVLEGYGFDMHVWQY